MEDHARCKHGKRVAVLDFETDPAKRGFVMEPFAWGFYDGAAYTHRWCHSKEAFLESLMGFLQALPEPHLIYAHNGGTFDYMFLLDHLEKELRLIGRRIAKAWIGEHELRDSFSIMPVKLKHIKPKSGAAKLEIDMRKLERAHRQNHKAEILRYLEADCVTLYDAVADFHRRFGDCLTMAGAAIRQLNIAVAEHRGLAKPGEASKGFKAYAAMNPKEDEWFRRFYYGGRVECFERGVIQAPPGAAFKMYDCNSMYPSVMRDFRHPTGVTWKHGAAIDRDTDFAVIEATRNDGALPRRAENGSLAFGATEGTFHATGHEIRAALDLGLLEIKRVVRSFTCADRSDFAPFVEKFRALRQAARDGGDAAGDLFYKLVMNSAYGKFAQNPDNYEEHRLTEPGEQEPDRGDGWNLHCMMGHRKVWSRAVLRPMRDGSGNDVLDRHTGAPVMIRGRSAALLNVATAASITGAARAVLMRAKALATRPLYCDTDSILCLEFGGEIDADKLGAWKLEKAGDRAAIAGKKLYALFQGAECVKQASKGVGLTAAEIERCANGETVTWFSDFPTYRLDGSATWIERRVRATA